MSARFPAGDGKGFPTMQDAWEEVESFRGDAETCAAVHRRIAAEKAAAHDRHLAAKHTQFALFHDRRAEIMTRICGLIDLAMRDEQIMGRLKTLAAEKRAADEPPSDSEDGQ